MKILMTLISASVIVVGQQASAVYLPGETPKPHTVCFEENLRDAGVQVLLTNVKTDVVRAEVYEMSLRGSDKVASRNTTRDENRAGIVYVGTDFSLTISRVTANGEDFRTGRLMMTLENGEKVEKTLKCDGIMHVMGAI